jgi:hypothetical protein
VRVGRLLLDALTSLKLTIVCLALLMVLVLACTIAQVSLGTLGAVNRYIRSFVVWYEVPGTGWAVAVMPGGATVGLVLAANLVVAQLRRLELSWKKAGLWIVHAGLVLLFVGEFVTSLFQVESRLAIEEGQTLDYVERARGLELAVIDTTDPRHDDVYGVPESLLANGGDVAIITHYGNDATVERFFRRPTMALCTDGLMPGPGQKPHPRALGAFPRALRMARELGIPLERIVQRLATLPCRFLRLPDPTLRSGADASLVLFDPERVSDRNDYLEPLVPNVGIDAVWVHGELLLDHGTFRVPRALPGRVLATLAG